MVLARRFRERTDRRSDRHPYCAGAETPSALSLMHLYPIDGAVRRVGRNDTAWNTRDATWSMVIAGIDPNPQKAGDITAGPRATGKPCIPYSADGGYVNFMMDDGDDSRLKATYGDNYDRLVALKAKYDRRTLPRQSEHQTGLTPRLEFGCKKRNRPPTRESPKVAHPGCPMLRGQTPKSPPVPDRPRTSIAGLEWVNFSGCRTGRLRHSRTLPRCRQGSRLDTF